MKCKSSFLTDAASSVALIATLVAVAPAASADDNLSWGAEANVMWPFMPGGIAEFRFTRTVANLGGNATEVIGGLHSDFSQRYRKDQPKVFVLASTFGVRQFLWRGLHVELHANVGWGHAEPDFDRLASSAWVFAGWRFDFGSRFYALARGGVGYVFPMHAPWPNATTGALPVGDLHLGVRF